MTIDYTELYRKTTFTKLLSDLDSISIDDCSSNELTKITTIVRRMLKIEPHNTILHNVLDGCVSELEKRSLFIDSSTKDLITYINETYQNFTLSEEIEDKLSKEPPDYQPTKEDLQWD